MERRRPNLRRLRETRTALAAWAALAVPAGAIAVAVDVLWLRVLVASLAILALAAIAILTMREDRAKALEELEERVRVPIGRLQDADPHDLGVDPEVIGGWSYVARRVDEALRAALADARGKLEVSLIVVRGPSKAGKSRTLYQAASEVVGDAWMVAPTDAGSLTELMKPGGLPALEFGPVVLWLDDVEDFVRGGAQGLTPAALKHLGEWERPVVVLATSGGKGLRNLQDDARRGLDDPLSALLGRAAKQVMLGRELGDDELAAAQRAGYAAEAVSQMKAGLGEYMIAAPRLERRLDEGEDDCPEGFAVVMAAVDCARAGMRGPIAESLLRELWPHYLRQGVRATEERFAEGLDWARRPLYSSIALVRGSAECKPYDYVVSYVDRVRRLPIHPEAWDLILNWAEGNDAFEAGIAAYARDDPERAARAFATAAAAVDASLAAAAAFNLGVLLYRSESDRVLEARRSGELHERIDDRALEAFRRADECGHAAGAFNVGQLLSYFDGSEEEAAAAFRRADERGHPDAPLNVGFLLEQGDDFAGAEAAYRRAENRGQKYGALNLANLLRQQGKLDAAEVAYLRAEEYGFTEAAGALSILLEERGDLEAARAASNRDRTIYSAPENRAALLDRRYTVGGMDGEEDAFRLADERGYAKGALELGLMLWNRRDYEGAEAAFRRALERGDAGAAGRLGQMLINNDQLERAEPVLRRGDESGDGESAHGLGIVLSRRGEDDAAEAAFSRAEKRGFWFGTWSLGDLLRERGDLDGAEAAYRRALAQSGRQEPGVDLGDLLRKRGDLDGAETAYRDVGAYVSLGDLLHSRGDVAGAEAAYRQASEHNTVAQERLADLLKARGG